MMDIDRKMHTESAIKLEVKHVEDSQSNLSRKSENSTDNLKRDDSYLDVEKEDSYGRSRESLNKSCSSLERKKLTQSGEFLSDFMTTIHTEETVKSEIVCEVHAEENKYRDKVGEDSDQESVEKERKQTSLEKKADTTEGPLGKKAHMEKDSNTSSENSSSDEDPETSVLLKEEKRLQTSTPLKINKATVEQQEDSEDLEVTEDVDKLDSDAPRGRHKKATPTIDTSRASGYYEYSLPTPKSVESSSSQNNTVFLFVNPDTAATEDSILLSHGGAVQEPEVKEASL